MTNAKYDLVIANGHIVDPDSGWDGIGNVGVNGEKIVAVSKEPMDGKRVIDASGLIVSPGFIDLHAHGQQTSANWMQAFDGVTTALELESGILPVAEFYEQTAKEGRPINYGASSGAAFARVAAMENKVPEPNILWWVNCFKEPEWQRNLATKPELDKILELLEQGIKEGGIGIGINAGYMPAIGRKEYYRLAELAKKYDVPIFTHVRYESVLEPRSSFEAVEEMIGLSFNPGAQMHICHLNSTAIADIDDIAEMVTSAIKNGARLTTEAYPYGASMSPVGSAYYREEDWRARFNMQTSDMERLGKPLTDASFDEMQKNNPEDAVICHFLYPEKSEKDAAALEKSVLLPGAAIATDGTPWLDITVTNGNALIKEGIWPLPENAFTHPRSCGTYSKFIKVYVRERNRISLIEAVRKMSLIPAQILEKSVPQMTSKGRLKVGADADIVVFDLNKIEDRSTFAQPNQHSVGMEYVIVNGTPLIESGNLNVDLRPGKAVRRPVTA